MTTIHSIAPRWGFDYLASLAPEVDPKVWGRGFLAFDLGSTDGEGSAVLYAHEVLTAIGELDYLTGISGNFAVSVLVPIRKGETRSTAALRIAGDFAFMFAERVQVTA